MKHSTRFAAAVMAAYGLAFGFSVQATDVSTKPLKADVLIKPNVIFGMDDSGSLDWEVMLDTTEGLIWLDESTNPPTAFTASGVTRSGSLTGSDGRYSYLFPIGIESSTNVGGAKYSPGGSGASFGEAAPPTAQFAPFRSARFNPIYYDTTVTYRPWPPAFHNGVEQIYGPADPTAAKASPHLAGSATVNLTVTQPTNLAVGYSFRAYTGHKVPVGSRICTSSTTGSCGTSTSNWTSAVTAETTVSGGPKMVTVPYYPATFWHVEACTPDNSSSTSSCVNAPGSTTVTLKRYEIRSGQSFPSGRTYADEMQNFANWWQYYRKRRHMLAGSMGQVFEGLTGMRLGVMRFNDRVDVTMHDVDELISPETTNRMRNAQRVSGIFYTNPANGGTPTRETMRAIGNQFHTNTSIIQSACQRNAAFIVTDGFANASPTPSAVRPPAYDQSIYGRGRPYETTSDISQADIALGYYTIQLRGSDFTAGRVPLGNQSVQNPDSNPNLHMNTYGLMLGIRGTIWPGITDAWSASLPPWPVVTTNGDRGAIDDLWHATINGRGKMYLATNPTEAANSIQAGLNDLLDNVGAQSSVAVSSVNLRRGDGKAYLGVYNPRGWTGDLTANPVNPSTGEISATPTWSAATRLLAKAWTTRVMATSVGGVGRPFTADQVGSIVNPATMLYPSGIYGNTTAVMNYLRGDRSGETSTPAIFRQRLSIMSAVINARPAVSGSDRVVYAASSEGMLHAIDADNGNELWAYVPGTALTEMGAQTRRTWAFETYLDGSPQIFTVGTRKVLIGGRGAAGGGYYALDVTNPRSVTTDADLASRVMWEFPATQGVTTAGNAALGAPVVVQTSSGPVALITQGYSTSNDAAAPRDGNVRMWMLNVTTGAVIHTFQVSSGVSGVNPGLAQVTGMVENDGTVRYVYGGDEQGNLWRFDLQARGTPLRIATLTDGTSTNRRQPITSAPTIVDYRGATIVLVGTGRMLGLSDFGAETPQSFYAIKDTGTTLSSPRSTLRQRTLTSEDGNGERTLNASSAVDWATDRGWYFDLPAGQQANTDPAALFGAAVFTTNQATLTDCSASSFMYVVDIATGGNVQPAEGSATSYAAARIGAFTVSSVMAMGYDGRGSRDFGFTFQRSTTQSGATGRSVDCVGSACRAEPSIRLPDMRRKNSWRQVQRN